MKAVTAFGPIVGPDPRLLILGSLPGEASLQAGQYYAHPRNAFWPIMGQLFGIDPAQPYRSRCAQLARCRVAVWDVLHRAWRPGSADADIVLGSAAPNAFGEFLLARPSIRCIAFNGATAAALFRRKVHATLPPELAGLNFVTLPSTSPAHASLDLQAKLQRWSVLIREVA